MCYRPVQIEPDSYPLVCVFDLACIRKESSEKPGASLPMWQARGNSKAINSICTGLSQGKLTLQEEPVQLREPSHILSQNWGMRAGTFIIPKNFQRSEKAVCRWTSNRHPSELWLKCTCEPRAVSVCRPPWGMSSPRRSMWLKANLYSVQVLLEPGILKLRLFL